MIPAGLIEGVQMVVQMFQYYLYEYIKGLIQLIWDTNKESIWRRRRRSKIVYLNTGFSM